MAENDDTVKGKSWDRSSPAREKELKQNVHKLRCRVSYFLGVLWFAIHAKTKQTNKPRCV